MKISYRPEIDGLRAIAVGAVILYHAQINLFGQQLFKGGFIGVDVFFVISGYLITSIILKEIITTGSFSLKKFYERRIRRILPALLFVMLVSLPFAWMYLLSSDLIGFSKSILYSLGFSSNFYFHYSGNQYRAQNGLFIPFLHMWSLSTEEQYYIIFPIILITLFKYFKEYLVLFLILSFFISLTLVDWGSKNYPSATFYLLHSRIWELLAGSLLSYYEITLGHRSYNKIINQIFSTLGLLIITLSIFYFNNKFYHPSYTTVIPIIGVSLVIWFSNKGTLANKILSSKLFVGIGVISYSLYLWHYPIFVFYRHSFASGSINEEILLIMLLFIFSLISYYFVEKKFRSKDFNFKKVLIIIFLSIFSIIFLNVIVLIKDGFPKKEFVDGISLDRLHYKNELIEFRENKINNSFDNGKKNILIFGDSHSSNFSKIFLTNAHLFKEYNFKYLGEKEILLEYFEKKLENIEVHNLIENSDAIIFSYFWSEDEFKGLEYIIELLVKKNNKKIILTSNNPAFDLYGSRYTPLDLFLIKNKRLPNENELINLEKKYYNFLMSNEIYNSNNIRLKKISEKFNIKLLDKSLYQCNNDTKRCLVLTNNNEKINWDSDHHTLNGAKFLGEIIFKMGWFNLK